MAEQDSGEERSEEPTAKRIEKAREDGQVARSQDLSVAAMMIGVAFFLYLFGGYFIAKLAAIFAAGFTFDRKAVFSETLLAPAFGRHALDSILTVMPIFALAVVIAFAAAGVMGGYIFSLKTLAPKASKLSPLAGFKRMFGLKAIVELSKALSKFLLVAGVLYLVVSENFPRLIQLGFMDVEPALQEAGRIIGFGALLVTLTLLISTAIDVPYQLYTFNQQMKMTKQEIKDEMKDAEGRPEVKAQIRRKQREIATGMMMSAVADADVVIVNPEHFAVALSYDPSKDGAPIMVAKGADLLAQSIRERAKEEGVPIFSSPALARSIFYTTELNQAVPESLYYAVAQVIAYIFSLNSFERGAQTAKKPNPKVPEDMRYDAKGRQVK
jgi:flagellar biosynthetic protein FlhB